MLAAPQAICGTLAKESHFIYNRRMSFATEEIAEVQNIVDSALKNHSHKFFPVFHRDDRELLDRMVRVEEELKHLREDSNRRFEEMQVNTNRRFEEMLKYTDKRFEEMFKYTDKRFEQVDKRFEAMQANTDKRFAEAQANTDKHFSHVNKRFTTMQWSINLSVAVIVALISILKFIQ